MSNIHIITPVKDSIETTLKTIEALMNSEITSAFSYTVYNDFSSVETTSKLEIAAEKHNFSLVNLSDFTSRPSPNYLLVLQIAQKQAIESNAHLLIVESDVIVEKHTIQQMVDYIHSEEKAGMIAAVTTDVHKRINFPYLFALKYKTGVIKTRKRLSFCCTILSNNYLKAFDFNDLDPEKSWYDVFISHKSVELGFNNYLLTLLPVTHFPHSSRPWKLLKYKNPLKYYWLKLTDNPDRI